MTSTVRDTLAYKIAGKLSNQGLIRRSDIGKVRAGIEQMLFAESAHTGVGPLITGVGSACTVTAKFVGFGAVHPVLIT